MGHHQEKRNFLMPRVRIAIALLLLMAACGQATAQYGGRRGGADRDRGRPDPAPRDEVTAMSPNDQVRLQLTNVRSALKLTPEQAAVWQAYENKVVSLLEDVARGVSQPQGGNALKQLDLRIDVVRNRLTAMEDIAEAAGKLYASLSDEQKAMADRTLAGTLPALYTGTPARAALRRGDGEGMRPRQ
jgi:LTXXQ motif family protein